MGMYTASTALLEALVEWGVTHIFANFGSDHPALIEAIAEARATGRTIPAVVTCPNEMVALSCAHGYAQATGRAQAVFVHVECGTQALAGAVHNAAKARVPVFIFAGMSPFTQGGELKGSRNEFIQWIQDVHDQRGIVRGYMKYDNEYRTGANLKQVTYRAMQIAHSEPKGPVYLVGAREVMEEAAKPVRLAVERWSPVAAAALPAEGVAEIAAALAAARRPLIVTSYVGRKPEAVAALVRLARAVGAGVLESVPATMNFPHDDPLYQGSHWNHPFQNRALAEADTILVVDSDVPWIPTVSRPSPGAAIYHIDVDPLKAAMPLWYLEARGSFRADAAVALGQLAEALAASPPAAEQVRERSAHYAARHGERAAELARQAAVPAGIVTAEYVAACLRRQLPADAIVLNEGITNYPAVADHMAPTMPGTYFASGGGSLGWHGGAAIGIKLAHPERTVAALTGDGSYMFSVPATVHWMARQYRTPFLTVVFNNRGWKAPKFSALAVHPDGYAARANDIDVAFDPPPDYAGIAAAAGGAFTATVRTPAEVEPAIAAALNAVHTEQRAAVLDVWLQKL
jgi:acetolactate synthase-1/2/3 large subunit